MSLPPNKLIHVTQVEGLEEWRRDLESLRNYYSASNVYTSIPKNPVSFYNVDEFLLVLQNRLNNLYNKMIKDKVRLFGRIVVPGRKHVYVESLVEIIRNKEYNTQHYPVYPSSQILYKNGEIVPENTYDFDYNIGRFVLDHIHTGDNIFTSDYEYNKTEETYPVIFVPSIPTNLMNVLDRSRTYNLYYENNLPILDENGNNLTYNFNTDTLSGIPSRRDESDDNILDGITYVPLRGEDVPFKIFPQGSFLLTDLPDNYLLDNEEFNTIVYQSYVDEIMVRLKASMSSIERVMDSQVFQAGEYIDANEAVILLNNRIYQANNQISSHASKVIGVSTNSGDIDDDIMVVLEGEVVNNSWDFDINRPIFVGTNGLLTQDPPSNPPAVFSLIIGIPVTNKKIHVTVKDSIMIF